jgi:hypothetical protein
MTPEQYRNRLLRLAEAGDWMTAERMTRAHCWRVLGRTIAGALSRAWQGLRRHRAVGAR